MKFYNIYFRVSVLLFAIYFISGCGGGGGGGGGKEISWSGSLNGENVIDGQGHFVQFQDSGEMIFDGKVSATIIVDSKARIIQSGTNVGGVMLVKASNGGAIAGLIGTNGRFLNVSSSPNSISLVPSNLKPVLTTGTGQVGAGGSADACVNDPNVVRYTNLCNAGPPTGGISACYCASAYLNMCAYKVTGQSAFLNQSNKDYEGMLAFTVSPSCPRP